MPSISKSGIGAISPSNDDDVHDAGALENGKTFAPVEPREAVAGEERPVDLLLPILPAAPFRDRRQERLVALLLELLAHDLLVPRARPDGVPGWLESCVIRGLPGHRPGAHRADAGLSPERPASVPAVGGVASWATCFSYSFFSSSFFHSMSAWPRILREELANFDLLPRVVHLVGDQVAHALERLRRCRLQRLELENLEAARRPQRLGHVARLHLVDQLLQRGRDFGEVDRPDQPAVGLGRRGRDFGRDLGEVLAADDPRANAPRPAAAPRRPAPR